MHDLVVAGGGPIGLAAALHAHRAGLSVVVREPRTGPIDKACGEGLMPGAVAELAALGVHPRGRELSGIRYLDGTVAVIIEDAAADDVAPVLMAAHGFTSREQEVAGYVCRGLSTREITTRLHLTVDTVQDHLKSVYGRTGVHSRAELVALIYRHDYLPHNPAG